ncbi:hypothetical protein DFH28DRAFT_241231 [Melampsora americana]|nr:hypothetical protein DFH28DRAFT_241231 [Melampsora americana]
MHFPQTRKRRKNIPDSDSSDTEEPLHRRPIRSNHMTSSPRPNLLQIDDEKAIKTNSISHPIFSHDSSCPDLSAKSTVDTDQKTTDISRVWQAVKVLEARIDLLIERVPPTNIPDADHVGRPKYCPCLTMKELEPSYPSEAPPLPLAPGSKNNNTPKLWSTAELSKLGCQLKKLIVNQMHQDFGPVTAIKPNIPTHLNTVETCHPDPPKLSKAAKKAAKKAASLIPPPSSDVPSKTPPILYGTQGNDWTIGNQPPRPTNSWPVPQASHHDQNILPYYPAPPLTSQSSRSSSNPGTPAIQPSKPKPHNANLTPLNPRRGAWSKISQLTASEAATTQSLQSKAVESTASIEPIIPESASLRPTTARQMTSDSNESKANASVSGPTTPVQANILHFPKPQQPGVGPVAKEKYSQLVNHPDPMARCVLEVCVRVIETITNAEVVEELARLPITTEVRSINTLISQLFQSQAETEQKLQGLLDAKYPETKAKDSGAQSHAANEVVQPSVSAEISRIKSALGHLIRCQNNTGKYVYKLLNDHHKYQNDNSRAKNELPAKTTSSTDTIKTDAKPRSHQADASEFAIEKALGQVQDYVIKEFESRHGHVDERLVQLESCDPRLLREDMKAQASQFKEDLQSSQQQFDNKLNDLKSSLQTKIKYESEAVKDQVTSSLERIQAQVAKLEGSDQKSDDVRRFERHLDRSLGILQARVAKLEGSHSIFDDVRRLEKSLRIIQDQVSKLEGSDPKKQMIPMRNEIEGKIQDLASQTSFCQTKLANSYTAYTELKALCLSLQSELAEIKTEKPDPVQRINQRPVFGTGEQSLVPSHSTSSPDLRLCAPKSRTHSILFEDEQPAIPADTPDYGAPTRNLNPRGSAELSAKRGDRHSSCKYPSNLNDIEHFRKLIEEEVANVMTASFEEDLKDSIQSDLMLYLNSEIDLLNEPNQLIRKELKAYIDKRLQELQVFFSLQSARVEEETEIQRPSLPSHSHKQVNQPTSTLNDDLRLKQKLSFMTRQSGSVPVEIHHAPSSQPEQHILSHVSNKLESHQFLSIPVASQLYAPLDRLITLEEDLAFLTSPETQRKATFASLGLCAADTEPNNAGLSVQKMLFELLVHGFRNNQDEEYVKGLTSELASVIMKQYFLPKFEPVLQAIDSLVASKERERRSCSQKTNPNSSQVQ